MFLSIYQYLKKISPKLKGVFFKLFFSSSKLRIGKNFQCNTWPSLIIDENAKVTLGDNILLRRNVEIRAHGNSSIALNGNNRIDRGVRILSANNASISIDLNTKIGLYSVLNGGDSIKIGEKVLISGFVYLQTSMHNHEKGKDVQDQGYKHAPIELENDVWLGTHVVILPNCIIRQGTVIGSNAVVTKSTDNGSILGGIPAKVIKERR
jgi:acetyltransferase-like isoleucine patch superfamily enzyme